MESATDKLKIWAKDLDEETLAQAERTAELPIVVGHVALMPDAHPGLGATIGSVVPTEGGIIPACVGVDIGCGMAAVLTDLTIDDLPDDLAPLLERVTVVVPAGVESWAAAVRPAGGDAEAAEWLHDNHPHTALNEHLRAKAFDQLGTLGSGNHFVEVSVDETGRVWVVLHSGSRGIGHFLATSHIAIAKAVAKRLKLKLPDANLAYLIEGTSEFDHYIADLQFAQAYAAQNRKMMLDAVLHELFVFAGKGREVDRVNAHHNYTEREHHFGKDVWITRKGAISARNGERGIIPGSMGTDTFIVEGLGNEDAYRSSAHGAGRTMSRTQARKELTPESLRLAMAERVWLAKRAGKLVDEHPAAYKDIDEVIEMSSDLVTVKHRLVAVLNYKGT
ncbi:MAG: RtcB family protein [Acidimicrobiia bacterium]|nr:RtcB family protein [Acidimicrobiia bacterium]